MNENDRKLKLAHLKEQYEAGLEHILDEVIDSRKEIQRFAEYQLTVLHMMRKEIPGDIEKLTKQLVKLESQFQELMDIYLPLSELNSSLINAEEGGGDA